MKYGPHLRADMESGGDLLSRTVTSQVPSALKGLTSVFGMGTGGTPSSLPPEMVSYFARQAEHFSLRNLNRRNSAPRSLLVSVDLTPDDFPPPEVISGSPLTTAQLQDSVSLT